MRDKEHGKLQNHPVVEDAGIVQRLLQSVCFATIVEPWPQSCFRCKQCEVLTMAVPGSTKRAV